MGIDQVSQLFWPARGRRYGIAGFQGCADQRTAEATRRTRDEPHLFGHEHLLRDTYTRFSTAAEVRVDR